ncbi:MAG TPA: hypothetical protein VHG51_12945 [Longimicrobiaceae bacterium]|nr:hypothetical protein [Longimicrobiaceae bacterium]
MTRHGLRLLLACALPAALHGCGGGDPDTISRERFVAANVALRRLDGDTLRTPADSARARAATLERLGVTEEQLVAYVDARRRDTGDIAETWREIAGRLASIDSVARADSMRRDSLARADTLAPRDSLARGDTAAARDTAATPPPRGVLPRERPLRRTLPKT